MTHILVAMDDAQRSLTPEVPNHPTAARRRAVAQRMHGTTLAVVPRGVEPVELCTDQARGDRKRRVEELRTAIADGSYAVPASALADALMRRMQD